MFRQLMAGVLSYSILSLFLVFGFVSNSFAVSGAPGIIVDVREKNKSKPEISVDDENWSRLNRKIKEILIHPPLHAQRNVILLDSTPEEEEIILSQLSRDFSTRTLPELQDAEILSLDPKKLRYSTPENLTEVLGYIQSRANNASGKRRKVIVHFPKIDVAADQRVNPKLAQFLEQLMMLEANNNIQIIGSTTSTQYSRQEAVFNEAFQKERVLDVTNEALLKILEIKKAEIETGYDVVLSPDVLELAKDLVGNRYYRGERKIPKTLELLRKAAARSKIYSFIQRTEKFDFLSKEETEEVNNITTRLEEITNEIDLLQSTLANRMAPKTDGGADSFSEIEGVDSKEANQIRAKIKALVEERTDLVDKQLALYSRYEKSQIRVLDKVDENIKSIQVQLENPKLLPAEIQIRLEQNLAQLEKQRAEFEASRETEGHTPYRPRTLDPDHLAKLVAEEMGISEEIVGKNSIRFFAELPDKIKEFVFGQDEAVDAVVREIYGWALGTKSDRGPIGSVMLMGETGIGKTYLGKMVAKFFAGNEPIIVRMEKYVSQHQASELFGSSPGYVGYGDPGELDKVRNQPLSVVIFDEIEKAHRDIFKTLLAILDDGILRTGDGKVIDFRNTMIFFTSNLGVKELEEYLINNVLPVEPKLYEKLRQHFFLEGLRERFPPEGRARLSRVLILNKHTPESLRKVVDQSIREINIVAKMKAGFQIEISEEAKDFIPKNIDVTAMHGRSLTREVENVLSVVHDMWLYNANVRKRNGIKIRPHEIIHSGILPGDIVRISVVEESEDKSSIEEVTKQKLEEKKEEEQKLRESKTESSEATAEATQEKQQDEQGKIESEGSEEKKAREQAKESQKVKKYFVYELVRDGKVVRDGYKIPVDVLFPRIVQEEKKKEQPKTQKEKTMVQVNRVLQQLSTEEGAALYLKVLEEKLEEIKNKFGEEKAEDQYKKQIKFLEVVLKRLGEKEGKRTYSEIVDPDGSLEENLEVVESSGGVEAKFHHMVGLIRDLTISNPKDFVDCAKLLTKQNLLPAPQEPKSEGSEETLESHLETQ
ncbi:MAG: AAA family ATPase [Bacteriovoracia bacterium]